MQFFFQEILSERGELIMTKNNKILVPEARQALNQFSAQAMEAQGYGLNSTPGEDLKTKLPMNSGFPLIRSITVALHPNRQEKLAVPLVATW